MNLKLTVINNNLESLFDEERDTKCMVCPLCDKSYKNEKSFLKHYEKAKSHYDCASTQLLFNETGTEEFAFENYVFLLSLLKKSAKTTMESFRRSSSYSNTIEITLMCIDRRINFENYISYVKKNSSTPPFANAILKCGLKESTIIDYRKFLRFNEKYIDSVGFARKHDTELWNDPQFVLNSFRRGDIGIMYLYDHYRLAERLTSFPEGIVMQFEELLEEKF